MEEYGFKFWLWVAGVFVAGAIGLFVFMLLLLGAIYAWGFLGAFLAIALFALVAGWMFDRRNARRHQSSY